MCLARGDIAIVDGGSTYFYIGTDQTTAGATTNDDWRLLVTPADELDAAAVLRLLNDNNANDDLIDADLLPDIPSTLLPDDLLTNEAGLFNLANVRENEDIDLRGNDFLQYNGTAGQWENLPPTGFLNVNTLTASEGGSLSYNIANRMFDFTPAAIPTVSGLPSAPTGAARYVLEVDSSGDADWELASSGATVDDMAPTTPSAGDLWYYTGGDDEAGNEPGLFVYYDDGTTSNWTSTTSMYTCLLYTSPSPRDRQKSRMPSSA